MLLCKGKIQIDTFKSWLWLLQISNMSDYKRTIFCNLEMSFMKSTGPTAMVSRAKKTE